MLLMMLILVLLILVLLEATVVLSPASLFVFCIHYVSMTFTATFSAFNCVSIIYGAR